MKKLFLIPLLLISIASFGQCDFTIKSAEYTWNGASVKPGQRVCLQSGSRGPLDIYNLTGTPEAKILLTNDPAGVTTIQGNGKTNSYGLYTVPFAIQIHNSKNFIVSGGEKPGDFGIVITKTHMGLDIRDLSTDFEVHNVLVQDISSVAFVAKTDPTCDSKTWRGNFTMRNVSFHHNKIVSSGDEGYYIGNSHYSSGVTKSCSGVNKTVFEHDVIGVEVFLNDIQGSGKDGIQVGSGLSGVNIYENTVDRAGFDGTYGHLSGVQINQGTVANIYKNKITNSKGYGVFIGGSGGSTIYENVIQASQEGAIILSDFSPIKKDPFIVKNNTLVDNKDHSIYLNSGNTVGNIFAENIVITKQERNKFPSYVEVRTVKGTIKTENLIGQNAVDLKLDSELVPILGSPAIKSPRDIGAFQHKPFIVTTTTIGTIEVIETKLDGVTTSQEFWLVWDGQRVRLK